MDWTNDIPCPEVFQFQRHRGVPCSAGQTQAKHTWWLDHFWVREFSSSRRRKGKHKDAEVRGEELGSGISGGTALFNEKDENT